MSSHQTAARFGHSYTSRSWEPTTESKVGSSVNIHKQTDFDTFLEKTSMGQHSRKWESSYDTHAHRMDRNDSDDETDRRSQNDRHVVSASGESSNYIDVSNKENRPYNITRPDNGNLLTYRRSRSQEHKQNVIKVGQGGGDRQPDNVLCQMLIPHSRLLACDCNNPFKQNYVAYLCCAPDDLSHFGLTFHRQLEDWGFRIFIAPRDLELTGPKYDNMTRWLEDRCNGKIIVILSRNYGNSDECLFLTAFARTLDPDSRKRNIIPVMIDQVEIPNVLKGLSIIKYNYDFRYGWLKKKLVNAIAA
uniref:TIR domain-containing protein n=3 Tax=Arion vulgaris TaxID=1028688 RepID=A0A0B7A459_9EUPU